MEIIYDGEAYMVLSWYRSGLEMKQVAESYARDLNESSVLAPNRTAQVVPAMAITAVQPIDVGTIEEWQSRGDWLVIA